ncbi:hypothetical protein FIBSPDRAFT_865468, partial [Athelia psychrophila]
TILVACRGLLDVWRGKALPRRTRQQSVERARTFCDYVDSPCIVGLALQNDF